VCVCVCVCVCARARGQFWKAKRHETRTRQRTQSTQAQGTRHTSTRHTRHKAHKHKATTPQGHNATRPQGHNATTPHATLLFFCVFTQQSRRTSLASIDKVRTAKQSIIHAGAAVIHAERMKLEELEHNNMRLRVENTELEEKITDLESQVEYYRMNYTHNGPERAGEEIVIKEVVQRVARSRKAQAKAESKVVDAEKKVRARGAVIKDAMAILQNHEKEYLTTTKTMEELGVDETNASDETAQKLARMKEEQKAKGEKARGALLAEYEAMVAEAEALNAYNEEYSTKTALREQQEQQQKSILGGMAGAGKAAAGGRMTNIRRKAGKKGPNGEQDDGCVVS